MSINGDLRLLMVTGIVSANILVITPLSAQDSYSPHGSGAATHGTRDSLRVRRSIRPFDSPDNHASAFYRRRGFYGGFSVSMGWNSFSAHPATIHTGFSYASSIQPRRAWYDGSRIVPAIASPSPVVTLGVEFSRRSGSFYGFDLAFTNTDLPSARTRPSNHSLSIKYGYSFLLTEQLSIRPMVLLGVNYLRVPFMEEIDNYNLDLYIFDNTFAYKTLVRSSRRGSYYEYSNVTSVNFYELAVLPKFQLDLTYQLTPIIALTVNGGYCWTLNQTDKIEISNRQKSVKIPIDANGLDFSSTLPPAGIFNYSGPYINVGLMLRF